MSKSSQIWRVQASSSRRARREHHFLSARRVQAIQYAVCRYHENKDRVQSEILAFLKWNELIAFPIRCNERIVCMTSALTHGILPLFSCLSLG